MTTSGIWLIAVILSGTWALSQCALEIRMGFRAAGEAGAGVAGRRVALPRSGTSIFFGLALALLALGMSGNHLPAEWAVLGCLVLLGAGALLLHHCFGLLEAQTQRTSRAEACAAHAEECAQANLRTIRALGLAIEARNPDTLRRVQRVVAYVDALRAPLGLTATEHEAVRMAAMLHDVGTLGTPAPLFAEGEQSDDDEPCRVKAHAELGAQIVTHLMLGEPGEQAISVASILRRHHERFDEGSCREPAESGTTRLARILGCLEAYDACVGPDVAGHRAANGESAPVDAGLGRFRQKAGSILDPELVKIVLEHDGMLREAVRDLPDPLGAPTGSGRGLEFAREIARRQREVERFNDSAYRLAGISLSVADVLGVVTRHVEQVAPEAIVIAYVLDDSRELLEIVQVAGCRRGVALDRTVLRVGSSQAGLCVSTRTAQVDVPAHGDLGILSEELASVYTTASMFPLVSDQVLGLVALYYDDGAGLDRDTQRLVEKVCELAAQPLRNARFHQTFHRHAITDSLTGLYNSRHLRGEGASLVRSRAPEQPLAVLMIDLDGFKAVNDLHGHEAGDEMLVAVAKTLRSVVRAGDVLVRKGGDEFVVIMVDTDGPTAAARAEEMRRAICATSVALADGNEARVGASIGVACAPDDGTSLVTLLRLADKRMYQKKPPRWRDRPFEDEPDSLPFIHHAA